MAWRGNNVFLLSLKNNNKKKKHFKFIKDLKGFKGCIIYTHTGAPRIMMACLTIFRVTMNIVIC